MTKTANGMDDHDVSRLHEIHWCTVAREGVPLFDGLPREIVHDTGDRIWFFVSYSEEPFPPEVVVVTDNYKSHDLHGNHIISVPAEWCNLIDEDDAETILQCAGEDDKINSYMN